MAEPSPKSDSCGVEVARVGDVTVAELTGQRILDETSLQEMARKLMRLAEDCARGKLVIDFGKVDYLSSAVLGKIVAVHKKLASEQGQLRLCNVRPSIREVFKITNLDKVVEIHPNRDAAVSSFLGRE
ncbi:MAG: STAS domain-containing protein [Planctomycetes bacterium]|nr:STAS domain-containing protein [Planctomycetota bacterium]